MTDVRFFRPEVGELGAMLESTANKKHGDGNDARVVGVGIEEFMDPVMSSHGMRENPACLFATGLR